MKRSFEYLNVSEIPKFEPLGLSVGWFNPKKKQWSIVVKEKLWDEYYKFCQTLREQLRPQIVQEIKQGIREEPEYIERFLRDTVDYYLWNFLDYIYAREWVADPNTPDTGKWCRKGILNRYSFDKTHGISFHPNGWLLASVHHSDMLKIWDIYAEEEVLSVKEDSGASSVEFSPDGTMLAIGGYHTIILRDNYGRNKIGTLSGHTRWVNSVAFSADSKLLVSGGDDGTVRVWDLASQQELRSFQIPSKPDLGYDLNTVTSVSFSSDGHLVAAGSLDGVVRVWDLFDKSLKRKLFGPLIHKFKDNMGRIQKVAFCSDGYLLAILDNAGFFKTVDLTSDKRKVTDGRNITANPFWTPTTTLAISPFNELIAVSWTGSATDPKLLLLNPRTHEIITRLTFFAPQCTHICFSPNGRYMATTSDHGDIDLLQIQTTEWPIRNCEFSNIGTYGAKTTAGFLKQIAQLSGQAKVKEIVGEWFAECIRNGSFEQGCEAFIKIAKEIWQVSDAPFNWDVMILEILRSSKREIDRKLVEDLLNEFLQYYIHNIEVETDEDEKKYQRRRFEEQRNEYLKILEGKG